LNHPNEPDVTTLPVADIVRDFYDKYPYPQPIDNLDQYRRLWQDPQRRRADYHLFWPARSYRDDHMILIAGCGTSQAAKHALRWPNAQVIGIDFSATSVQHTEALKQKYDLKNLRVYQLPIERASELATQFDQIVCTGVLHHLENPDAGLQALRGLLKPDGAMHLMVYAPYGRTGIYLLQEFCRRIGIQATDADIRDLMVALRALPPGHPLEHLLREAPDFRQAAELADALLHPHDRAYSVPQLFDLIASAGLAFGRWVKQAPYLPHCGVIAQLPLVARIAQLPPAEQYAAVELFRGTMVRHSAIVYRNDFLGGPQPIGFTGDAWLDYVPIRMSDTISVQEKLPPATAAVLINQTHSYTDLFLPINAAEKRLFDAIDGVRRIAEIVEQTPSAAPHDAARAFFERLWWYDQVVFDAAPQSGENSARRTSQ
jgi:SAM-dependent methyltransferase